MAYLILEDGFKVELTPQSNTHTLFSYEEICAHIGTNKVSLIPTLDNKQWVAMDANQSSEITYSKKENPTAIGLVGLLVYGEVVLLDKKDIYERDFITPTSMGI